METEDAVENTVVAKLQKLNVAAKMNTEIKWKFLLLVWV